MVDEEITALRTRNGASYRGCAKKRSIKNQERPLERQNLKILPIPG
jgi:hypothetical protein